MQNRKANQIGKIRKKYTEEQITQILKEAEVSNNVSDTLRKYGINDSSYYRWKARFRLRTGIPRLKTYRADRTEFCSVRRL